MRGGGHTKVSFVYDENNVWMRASVGGGGGRRRAVWGRKKKGGGSKSKSFGGWGGVKRGKY